MSDLTLNTRITFTTPEGVISDTGRELIQRFIQGQAYDMTEWKQLNPDTEATFIQPLPDNWQWKWIVTEKGNFVGTFPKRVSKFYRLAQNLKCPTSFLTELGNLARSHASEPETYEFEFVDSIDWYAGKFGDHGSCYWRDRKVAKKMLTDNGGLAVCFYEDGTPKGRAWFVPQNDMFFVFNGYGFAGNPTLEITKVMAQYFNLSYKKIDLYNYGTDSGVLYINGGIGYVIGNADEIAPMASHDLELDGDYMSCDRCGDYVDDDHYYIAPNHETYCEDCFDDQCGYCADCDETFWNDDLTEAYGNHYCHDCLIKSYKKCDGCSEHFEFEELTLISGESFCESCRDESYEQCSKCEEWKPIETFVNKDDDIRICGDCHQLESEADSQ